MSLRELRPTAGQLVALIWLAGLLALAGTTVSYLINDNPYPAPWAWISFVAMMAIDDLMFGSGEDACWSELPKITLLAGVIVFRRHPEIIVLTAMAAGPLASLIKRQPWFTQLTTAAHWILAAAIGSAVFRLVGFADTPHFVAATVALGLIYFALGPILTTCLEAAQTGSPFWPAFRRNARVIWLGAIVGAGLALVWRSPSLGSDALKGGELALVALIGAWLGFMLGGQVRYLLRNIRLRNWHAFMICIVLGLSLVVPSPFSWLCVLAVLAAIGFWAFKRRTYGLLCGVLGGLCNVVVVTANGGRMPVLTAPDGSPGDFTDASHMVADAHTSLAWLADRIPMHVFPGIASPGDLLIALGIIWFVAAQMRQKASGALDSTNARETIAA